MNKRNKLINEYGAMHEAKVIKPHCISTTNI